MRHFVVMPPPHRVVFADKVRDLPPSVRLRANAEMLIGATEYGTLSIDESAPLNRLNVLRPRRSFQKGLPRTTAHRMGDLIAALLRKWPIMALGGILWLLGSLLLARVLASITFFDRYVKGGTPGQLAAIRILTCGILLGSTIWENLASSASLPGELRQPMGVMRVLYALPLGVDRLVGNAGELEAFKWFAALTLFLGMVGLATRITVPLGALCYLLVGGILRQYAWFYHQGIMPLYLMMVLSWTPCGDGLSVDRLLKIAQNRPVPPADRPVPVYGWSRYACWIVIALPYVEAGLSKLRNGGLFWWDARNLKPLFYAGALESVKPNWALSLRLTHAPDILFNALGIAAILIELAYGAVLFSRMARRVLPYAAAVMHVGIWLLQNILFYDLLLLQLVFVDWSKVRNTIGRWLLARDGRLQVLHPSRVASEGAMSPLGVSAIVVAVVFVWIFGIEYYPLTAWPMYSYWQPSTEVVHTKIYVRDESGGVFRAYVSDAIPALAGTRAVLYVAKCFDPRDAEGTRLCRSLLSAAAAAYNRTAPPSRRVVQFELKKWSWDLRAFPSDPLHATLVGDTVFTLPWNNSTSVDHP